MSKKLTNQELNISGDVDNIESTETTTKEARPKRKTRNELGNEKKLLLVKQIK